MIDRLLLPLQRAALAPIASLLLRRGVAADRLTLTGFALGLLVPIALALGKEQGAMALILANRVLDGLDGAVARLAGPTDRGAFLDIALDLQFYSLVPLGFALADPSTNALAAAVLITAFVGTGSSFLAFATIAHKRGIPAEAYPQKGFYYLGGLAEGTETIAVFVAMCLWPQHFVPIAYGYTLVCVITIISRWFAGWRTFSD